MTAARYEAEGFQKIYGVPSIGSVTPPEALAREGESWQRVLSPEATPAQIVSRDGFDYGDAGIGAAVAMGAALLVATGTLATRRHRRPAHS